MSSVWYEDCNLLIPRGLFVWQDRDVFDLNFYHQKYYHIFCFNHEEQTALQKL